MNNVRTDCFAYNKECKFFKEAPIRRAIEREIREYPLRARTTKNT